MAPRRDFDGAFRRENRRNNNGARFAKKGRKWHPTQVEADGDLLMGGYRIPTIISSKGAVQHKQDRYAPIATHRGDGHKRHGGCWDEGREAEGKVLKSTPVDDRRERYGDETHPIVIQDDHNHRTYYNHTSSRRGRHARDYQKSVHSSRIRYERDRHVYNRGRSDYYGNYGTQDHYSNNQRSRSRGSTSYSLERSRSRHSNHSSSQYSTSHSTRERGPYRPSERYGSRYQGESRDNPSNASRWSQGDSRRYYDQARSQDDHQWRLRVRGDRPGDIRPAVDFDGPLEDAMRGLASHAAKFLKNASRRDRALVETAVWKAYGDSIASLGYRHNTGRAENRTREWVSARGISNRRDTDFRVGARDQSHSTASSYNGSMANRNHPSVQNAAIRRGRALEQYRQANRDYERTWEDLFGAGSYSGSASYAGSEAGSETASRANSHAKDHTRPYEYSNKPSTQSVGRSQGNQSTQLIRNRSRSPGSDSTVTAHHMRQQVPRPRIPPDRPTPVYRQDPNDPTRFLNVPRPWRQWNIPADKYNGAAWAVHRKSDFETGAIPHFYPDRWVSGQSFGSAAKDVGRKGIPANIQKSHGEILGRECYREPTPALTNNSTRSQSVASDLAGGFCAIRLNSVPPRSERGDADDGSELADDFDLYSPSMQLETYENTHPENPKQIWSLANASGEQTTQFNSDNSGGGGSGSATPIWSLANSSGERTTQFNNGNSNVDDDGSAIPIWSLANYSSQQLARVNNGDSNVDDDGSATPIWSLANSSEQQLDDDSSDVDDGSSTPKQGCLSYNRFFSRDGSAESDTFTSYNQRSMGGNPLLVDDNLSSRESTPSLCLADFMHYDSRKVSSLLNSEGSQCNLIDLSSPAPSSPNGSRCGSVAPLYGIQSRSRANSRQSSLDCTSIPTRSHADHILDDDWESSFGIVARDRRFTLKGTGNKENPLLIDDDDEEPTNNRGGGGVSNRFQGLNLKPDIDTEDEPNFMGIDWFSKQTLLL